MMIICGAVISDVVKENVQSNNLCSGTPRQCGPDWLSNPPSPLPVTRASHYRVPGGENQLSDVVPQKPTKNNNFEREQSGREQTRETVQIFRFSSCATVST